MSCCGILKVYSVTVPEDIEVGSEVIQVTAVDPDAGSNSALRYVIPSSSSSSSWFSVNANTGHIRLTKSLDRERLAQMQFHVSRSFSLRIHVAINIHELLSTPRPGLARFPLSSARLPRAISLTPLEGPAARGARLGALYWVRGVRVKHVRFTEEGWRTT